MLELWAVWALREANDQHLVFRTMGPGPGESSMSQPEVVKRVLADGASALLVVQGDSPELAQSLADAEAEGRAGRPDRPVDPGPGRLEAIPVGFTHAPFPGGVGRSDRVVERRSEDAKKRRPARRRPRG